MNTQFPHRERKNIVALCKAIIKMAEGPGEIDSLVNKLCDTLGDLLIKMRDADSRARAEQAEAQAKLDPVRELLVKMPKDQLEQLLKEYEQEQGLEQIPEDLEELEA